MKKTLCSVLIMTSFCFVAHSQYGEPYPENLDKKKLNNVIITEVGAYAAGLSFLSFIWYEDLERVPFHYYNDNKGYLQMDKFGHAFSAYRQTYSSYYALRRAGLGKKKSLLYGGPAGLLFQTPIEIFDGIHEGWGFSWGDMIANSFGPILFVTQEALFDRQLVTMKFSYAPSPYPKYHSILGETKLESFFLDYNGHTYWFSANLKGITNSKALPPWLNLAIGYSANGVIKEFENPAFYRGEPFPHLDRYRQYLLSLDIDFTQVKTNKKWLKKTFKLLNLIKIPFPTIEINRIDGLKARALYF